MVENTVYHWKRLLHIFTTFHILKFIQNWCTVWNILLTRILNLQLSQLSYLGWLKYVILLREKNTVINITIQLRILFLYCQRLTWILFLFWDHQLLIRLWTQYFILENSLICFAKSTISIILSRWWGYFLMYMKKLW